MPYQTDVFLNIWGTQSDLPSPDGSVMARLRQIALSVMGAVAEGGQISNAAIQYIENQKIQSVTGTALLFKDPTGALQVLKSNHKNHILVDNSGNIQPVSIETLPSLSEGTNKIGRVSIDNFPENQLVKLEILPSLSPGNNKIGSVTIDNFPINQDVIIKNFPENQLVSLETLPSLSTGNNRIGLVSVDNFPTIQNTNINNFPETQRVSLETLPSLAAGNNKIGSVSIDNFPLMQNVSVSNFPKNQNVILESLPTGNNKIGVVSIDNFPNQEIAVNNFPSVQKVTLETLPSLPIGTNKIGSVSIDNFPETQKVNLDKLPSLSPGNNVIGSIANTEFTVLQKDVWNVFLPNGASTDNTLKEVRDRLPGTLGAKTAALSLPVTLSTDGIFATAFGKATDITATTDNADTGFISLLKRLLVKITSGISIQGITNGTPVPISLAPTQKTPTVARLTGTGTIAAGSCYLSITNVGNINATVLGTTLDANRNITFPARFGETIGEISYAAASTTLLVVRIA